MERYMIAQDNDCHWYLFKIEDRKTFGSLIECAWDEITPDGEKWLDERRIDGPHRLTFTDPKEE